MKALLLLPLVVAPLFMTGCDTVVVEDRHPRRTAYVERDVVVDRHSRRHYDRDERDVVVNRYPRRPGYVERDVVVTNPRARRDVVVVDPRPSYSPAVSVRYYNDTRGRYYIKDGRRVYSNAGVRY